jgi:disulfide bond formation protein DsbB
MNVHSWAALLFTMVALLGVQATTYHAMRLQPNESVKGTAERCATCAPAVYYFKGTDQARLRFSLQSLSCGTQTCPSSKVELQLLRAAQDSSPASTVRVWMVGTQDSVDVQLDDLAGNTYLLVVQPPHTSSKSVAQFTLEVEWKHTNSWFWVGLSVVIVVAIVLVVSVVVTRCRVIPNVDEEVRSDGYALVDVANAEVVGEQEQDQDQEHDAHENAV